MNPYLDDGVAVTEAEASEHLRRARHAYADTENVLASCGDPEMRRKWQGQLNRINSRIQYWEANTQHCRDNPLDTDQETITAETQHEMNDIEQIQADARHLAEQQLA